MAAWSRASRSLTASLSFSSNSSPSDLANSSSMVTVLGVSIDLAVTSNSAVFAGERFGRIALREGHLDLARFRRPPMPTSWSSKPGMNWLEPTLTATSSPVPPSNGVPSILPMKSITTRSPCSTLAPSAFAAYGRFCSAIWFERRVDLGVGDLGDQPLELDGA